MRRPNLHVNGASVKDYPVNLPLLERSKSDLMAQHAPYIHQSPTLCHTMATPSPQVYRRLYRLKSRRTAFLAKPGPRIRPNLLSPHSHMNPTFAGNLAMR